MAQRLVVALLGLACLSGCLAGEDPSSSAATSSAGQLRGQGQGMGNRGLPPSGHVTIGDYLSPEQRRIRQQRVYSVRARDQSGQPFYESFHETLVSEGTGRFSLRLLDYASSSESGTTAGTGLGMLQALYEWRQRFLVRYRDVHIEDKAQVLRNYNWRQRGGDFHVAGRAVHRFVASSKRLNAAGEALTRIELDVDQVEQVILGWKVFDEAGEVERQLVTESVDFQPSLSGVTWSTPRPEQAYESSKHDQVLGFQPRSLLYVPQGFVSVQAKIIFVEQLFPGENNLFAEYLSDGLQFCVVAQHGRSAHWSSVNSLIRVAEISGVRMVEANLADRNVFVIGAASEDELMATLGSVLAQ